VSNPQLISSNIQDNQMPTMTRWSHQPTVLITQYVAGKKLAELRFNIPLNAKSFLRCSY